RPWPSPTPPWVVHSSVPQEVRDALQIEFLEMHKGRQGRDILENAGILGSSESPTKTTIPFVKWNVSPPWSSGEMGAKGSNSVVRRVRPASENDATIPHLHSLEARVSRVIPPRLVRNRRERSGVPEPNPAQGVQCLLVRRQRS